MSVRVNTTTTITLTGRVTVNELADILDTMPSTSSISFSRYEGDQRDPGYTTLTITHDGAREGITAR